METRPHISPSNLPRNSGSCLAEEIATKPDEKLGKSLYCRRQNNFGPHSRQDRFQSKNFTSLFEFVDRFRKTLVYLFRIVRSFLYVQVWKELLNNLVCLCCWCMQSCGMQVGIDRFSFLTWNLLHSGIYLLGRRYKFVFFFYDPGNT